MRGWPVRTASSRAWTARSTAPFTSPVSHVATPMEIDTPYSARSGIFATLARMRSATATASVSSVDGSRTQNVEESWRYTTSVVRTVAMITQATRSSTWSPDAVPRLPS